MLTAESRQTRISGPAVLVPAADSLATPLRMAPAQVQAMTVVVPICDEADVIEQFHERLRRALEDGAPGRGVPRDWDVVYVNDGSTDDTPRVLRQIAERDRRVTVVNLRRNFGQTAALAAGLDHARGDVIVTMDGDLQHLPEEIPLFLEKLGAGHDLVLGYREVRRDSLLLRRIPSRCANYLMRRLSGVAVRDFGSTFKAFRRDVAGEIEMFGEVHRFLPVLAAMSGCDMAEVPITDAPRRGGRSKYGLGRVFGVFVDIILLALFSGYATRPGRPWGYLALVLGGFGIAIQATLLALYGLSLIPTPLDRPGWLMLSVLLECSGLQCLGFAAMSELLGRTYFASRGKPIYTIRSVLGRAAPVGRRNSNR